MLQFIAQPTIPGVDPSWFSWPGVKAVVGVGIVVAVVLGIFNKLLFPMLVTALQNIGVLGKTWRQCLEEKVQKTEEKVQTTARGVANLDDAINPNKPAITQMDSALKSQVVMIGTGDGTKGTP